MTVAWTFCGPACSEPLNASEPQRKTLLSLDAPMNWFGFWVSE
jgi:hypothetical protein